MRHHLAPWMPPAFQIIERALLVITRSIALLGGATLIALTLVTVYSIVGRWSSRNLTDFVVLSWWRPIRGDFELVEIGTAIAIFAFLPYTQLARGNVLVDFFTASASPRVKAALAVPANLLFSALAILFTWRMSVGAYQQYSATFMQTTMILRVPLWWGHAIAALLMAVLALVCLFSVWRSILEALREGEG